MRCERCQLDNALGMRFCVQCGAPLAQRCPACGVEVAPTFRFCGQCGAGLQAPPGGLTLEPPGARPTGLAEPGSAGPRAAYTPKHLADKILKGRSALEGERRQVTVLFADLAGFTSLAERLDPEAVHAIVDRCFEAITAEVHRLEGTINQYTGDGVMALFGAPIAHEDGPRRAVHAALGIQRAMQELSRELQAERGFALEMRLGLNTGPVVVGRIGDDLRMDYTAVGDTTNLAARLQQAARPGGVLVSEATHRAIAGFFETRDLGELPLRGHAPVRAWEVLRTRGRRARLDVAVERGLTPLVGRGRELDTLAHLFSQVKAGRGQVVSITGEAGIGKSRLVLEFRRALAAAGEPATWLEGRSVSFGQAMPFLPVIEQLRENFGIAELDGEPEIVAKVEQGMRRMGGMEPHIPYVRHLLAVDPGDPAITAMDAAPRRKRLLDANRALALRGAALRPLVLVFEDLHWIDRSSEDHIDRLVDSLAGVPILLILTYRVGYAPRFGTRTFHSALTLGTLNPAEALALAGGVLGAERFPEELRAAVLDKAEGVPLFVEEVTKTLVELGVIQREEAGHRVVRRLDEVRVPETIQEIIMARLDRLGEEGKRTVQLASVIGRQFLHRLLERIAGLAGRLEGLLAELKALEIIYEAGLLPEPAYVFKHAVIQDVAYQSLLVRRRTELHRLVGLAIEELYPDRLPEHYAELAHHFAQAQEWRKALDYGAFAGDRAARAFANAEAAAHYARVLEAAARLTPPPEPRALADLHSRHGAVLMVLGQHERSVGEYGLALQLARQLGDRPLEAEILMRLGEVENYYHRPDRSLAHLADALAIARDSGDRAGRAICLAITVLTRACVGELLPAAAQLEDALRLAPEVRDPRQQARALGACGVTLQWRGEFDRALACLHRAAALAEESHAGFTWGQAAFHLGHVHLARGAYEDALDWYRRLQDYAVAAGDRHWMVRSPNTVGGVYLELFDFDEVLRLGLEGDELCQQLWRWPEPRAHSLLKVALAHLGRGELGLADEVLGRTWALLERDVWLRWRWHIPLLRARGAVALAAGRHDEAWDFAGQSLEMAAATEAHKHVVRAELLRGEILLARDRLEEAIAPLSAAVALAERLATPREVWLGRAALGRVFSGLGRDRDAEASFAGAAQTVEGIAARLTAPSLRRSFLGATPVADVYRALGRRPPS